MLCLVLLRLSYFPMVCAAMIYGVALVRSIGQNCGAQITEGMVRLRDELRQVNHNLRPCLAGDDRQPLKVAMQFACRK